MRLVADVRRLVSLERRYSCRACGEEYRSWMRLHACPDCGERFTVAVIRRVALAPL